MTSLLASTTARTTATVEANSIKCDSENGCLKVCFIHFVKAKAEQEHEAGVTNTPTHT